MPLYKYECQKCKTVFENYVKNVNESKNVICINCGEHKKIKKIFSSRISFMLKGKGFYKPGFNGHNTSTPTDPYIQGEHGSLIKFDEYSDKNTGEKLGYSKPEVVDI